jgi:hypothetical protein
LTLIYAGITVGGLYFTSNGWPPGTIGELQGKCQQIHFTGLAIAVSLYSVLYTWRLNASCG